ncbi:MAG: Gfo/Idh/MocA family oxidoreductase [Nitrospinota bacterium]|nr:Gfo/Idh/MocA family oxidoreductase [Nitrospinota bacterium]
MEQNNKAAVAVVGAGYWGKNLIRNFHALGVLRAIVDSDPKTRQTAEQGYPGVAVTQDLGELLRRPDINAVALATPAETHFQLACQCILAGKDVFVEKPLSLNVEDGERLVALAREKGRTLMVGHLLQYHPAVVRLKQLVAAGELGPLQYIYSNRLNLGKIRTEENILWSFAPHDISVILSLVGHLPISVVCHGSHFLTQGIADVTLSHLTFGDGVAAHIFVSWLHPFKEQKLVIVGEKSMAVFNDTEPENKLLLYPHVINWKSGVPAPERREAVAVAVDKVEPLQEECRSFVEAVETGRPPRTDGAEGLDVLKTLSACQLSMEQGGRVITL